MRASAGFRLAEWTVAVRFAWFANVNCSSAAPVEDHSDPARASTAGIMCATLPENADGR